MARMPRAHIAPPYIDVLTSELSGPSAFWAFRAACLSARAGGCILA